MSRTKRTKLKKPRPKFEVGDWVEVRIRKNSRYSESFKSRWNGWLAVVQEIPAIGKYMLLSQLLFSPHRANPEYKGYVMWPPQELKRVCKKSELRP